MMASSWSGWQVTEQRFRLRMTLSALCLSGLRVTTAGINGGGDEEEGSHFVTHRQKVLVLR